ncbi:MAG: peptide chain release factor N(5)-glutamine methyltransferase [Clostridia bacterium]|nr:peptide chain release factor N(5)-glutamine methyltransferase [Clostridia bacterium]
MTIREAIYQAMIQLKMKKIESPKLKARLLMQFMLGKTRQYIMVYDEKKLTQEQEEKYFKNVEKLIKGIPLQHITHQQEFMKMNFYVNKDVLIPRPDTEILVEEVIQIAQKIRAKKILDLCTGSGAIAISLAKYIQDSQITATDISNKALEIAQKNAKNNQVENQIAFLSSNLWEELPKEKYDMIVSNPPYIKREIIKSLEEEVQKEPLMALDGGWDGLDFYRKIVKQAYEYLKYGGYLCLEIGYDQKIDVIELIEQEEKYTDTYGKKDLYGNDRVIITKVGD